MYSSLIYCSSFFPLCSCRAFDIPFYVGMIVPFLIIYIFNWVVFIIIFTSLLRKSCDKKLKEVKETDKKKGDKKTSPVKQQFLVAVTLSVLFGLGWGVGLLATDKVYVSAIKDLFASLFVILTTSQGLLVFIMHCLQSRDIRNVWARWFKFATGKEVNKFTSVVSRQKRKSGPTASASIGGMSIVSEDGKERTVFENPMELQEMDPFYNIEHPSTSASQHSFKSVDFIDESQTSFTNPFALFKK